MGYAARRDGAGRLFAHAVVMSFEWALGGGGAYNTADTDMDRGRMTKEQ